MTALLYTTLKLKYGSIASYKSHENHVQSQLYCYHFVEWVEKHCHYRQQCGFVRARWDKFHALIYFTFHFYFHIKHDNNLGKEREKVHITYKFYVLSIFICLAYIGRPLQKGRSPIRLQERYHVITVKCNNWQAIFKMLSFSGNILFNQLIINLDSHY